MNINKEICIHVDRLSKWYGSNIHAINDISLDIRYGEIFGFLGPNGAGKTTTIKILTTLIRPSSGTVNIFGKDIDKHRKEIRSRIGIILQKPSFEPTLTVEKSLDLYAKLWHINDDVKRKRIKEILEVFDLEGIRNSKNEDLSIGQRRRVQIGREFIHDMDLLFLDEPTFGLDPAARRAVLDYIKGQARNGLTVFFTTHLMEEAEFLCDRIAVINKGNIIALDTVAKLKQQYGGLRNIAITFRENVTAEILDLLKLEVGDSFGVQTSKLNVIRIDSVSTNEAFFKIMHLLSKNALTIENISIASPSLEEVFLNITKNLNSI